MRDKLTPKRGIPALGLLVAASVGLAACGDDDANKQEAATPKKVAVTAAVATRGSRP